MPYSRQMLWFPWQRWEALQKWQRRCHTHADRCCVWIWSGLSGRSRYQMAGRLETLHITERRNGTEFANRLATVQILDTLSLKKRARCMSSPRNSVQRLLPTDTRPRFGDKPASSTEAAKLFLVLRRKNGTRESWGAAFAVVTDYQLLVNPIRLDWEKRRGKKREGEIYSFQPQICTVLQFLTFIKLSCLPLVRILFNSTFIYSYLINKYACVINKK